MAGRPCYLAGGGIKEEKCQQILRHEEKKKLVRKM
jgi:hypothetical protein